jgi:hypothetical protein
MRFSLRYPQAGAPKGDLSNDQLFRAALGCASSGFAFNARDLTGRAGRVVVLQATYRATPVLTQGKAPPGRPRDHALLELGDGTRVLVEPYGSSEGVRDAKELALDGAVVHATGVWRSGPTGELQSPMNPALEHAVVIPIR